MVDPISPEMLEYLRGLLPEVSADPFAHLHTRADEVPGLIAALDAERAAVERLRAAVAAALVPEHSDGPGCTLCAALAAAAGLEAPVAAPPSTHSRIRTGWSCPFCGDDLLVATTAKQQPADNTDDSSWWASEDDPVTCEACGFEGVVGVDDGGDDDAAEAVLQYDEMSEANERAYRHAEQLAHQHENRED